MLKKMVADWPRRRRNHERYFKRMGVDVEEVELDLTVSPPKPVKAIPTFKHGVTRPLSPMLRDRFRFASTINKGGQIWLAAEDIPRATRRRAVRGNHVARREYWEDSAPMRFPDADLSLFVVDESPEDVVYLVWKPGATEPELWKYHSQSERVFKNLEAYLRWSLS